MEAEKPTHTSDASDALPALKIPQATARGYVDVGPGMVFDFSFPNSKLRRGRLQLNENGDCICPTLTAAYGQLYLYEDYEMEEPRIKQIGNYKGDGTNNPQTGRVYDPDGLAPTLIANGQGGDREPKILQIGSYSPSSACNAKVLDADGLCPTLLDHKGAEPAILTPVRTEKAKRLRREGIESFAHRELVPRKDGVSNTITTVQKDNMLIEPSGVIGSTQANAYRGSVDGVAPCINAAAGMGGGHVPMIVQRPHGYNDGGMFEDVAPTLTTSSFEQNNVVVEPKIIGYSRSSEGSGKVMGYHTKDTANTLHGSTGSGGNTDQFVMEAQHYRIRKLCPTETYRLMGVGEDDIKTLINATETTTLKNGTTKVKPLISKSAHYRLAGNSIVVSCLYHIFRTAFIPGQPENEVNQPSQLSLFD